MLLAHAMLFTLRGVPVVYYGDEQGFAGQGGDQDARQDMFASQVELYNTERPLGAGASGGSHFNSDAPLYRGIAELARLRSGHAALRRGVQLVRAYGPRPGLFAVSRIDPDDGREFVVAFNTSTAPISARVLINAGSRQFLPVHGQCEPAATAPGSYHVDVPALGYLVCASIEGK